MTSINAQLEKITQELASLREQISAFRFESHQEHQQLFRMPWETYVDGLNLYGGVQCRRGEESRCVGCGCEE